MPIFLKKLLLFRNLKDKGVRTDETSSGRLAVKIPFEEIKRATINFSPELLIGEGGIGEVYNGTLDNGLKVAVRRHKAGLSLGSAEFDAEVTLSQFHYPNIVSLIGYCDERSEKILVNEYMEEGTLKNHLYHSDGPKSKLSWEQRLQICIDSVEALHYLHTGCRGGRIIHRDVKSSAILLDKNYTTKLSNLGFAQSDFLGRERSTTVVRGTLGYLDPLFYATGIFTEKSDVYAFGVVLLEVICARPTIMWSRQEEERNLAWWVAHWNKEGDLEKIIDPVLVGTVNSSSLKIFGETALKCLREKGEQRPVMREVLWNLELALELQRNRNAKRGST